MSKYYLHQTNTLGLAGNRPSGMRMLSCLVPTGLLFEYYRPRKSRARKKEVGGTWEQEIHFLHVNRYNLYFLF